MTGKVIGRISFHPRPDDPFEDLVIDEIEEPPAFLFLSADDAATEEMLYSVVQVYDVDWPTGPAPEAA